MDRKILILLIGIIAALFMVVISDLLALGIWIYIVWMIWKQQTNIFDSQLEPEKAKRLLIRLKRYLMIAGFSFLAFIILVIVHNALDGLSKTEEIITLIIAFVAHLVFVITTVISLNIFLNGRSK